jgi:hypothetical protein
MVSHTEPPNTYQARSVNRQKEILSEKYAFPFNVQPTKRSGLFVATQARHETGSPNGAVRLANCGQFTARTMGRPAKQVAEAETAAGRARHSVRAVGARLDAPPRLRRAGDCPPYLRPAPSRFKCHNRFVFVLDTTLRMAYGLFKNRIGGTGN